jgi:hypothetical protein
MSEQVLRSIVAPAGKIRDESLVAERRAASATVVRRLIPDSTSFTHAGSLLGDDSNHRGHAVYVRRGFAHIVGVTCGHNPRAAAGGWIATHLQGNLAVFGAGIFLLGMVCAVLTGSAYRFAGITLTITKLIPRGRFPLGLLLNIASAKFPCEILVDLVISALWPTERSSTQAN